MSEEKKFFVQEKDGFRPVTEKEMNKLQKSLSEDAPPKPSETNGGVSEDQAKTEESIKQLEEQKKELAAKEKELEETKKQLSEKEKCFTKAKEAYTAQKEKNKQLSEQHEKLNKDQSEQLKQLSDKFTEIENELNKPIVKSRHYAESMKAAKQLSEDEQDMIILKAMGTEIGRNGFGDDNE